MHRVDVVAHVAHVPSQAVHTPLDDAYVPDGHAATQLVPLSSGVADVDEQLLQPLDPVLVHVAHVESHVWHAVPSE